MWSSIPTPASLQSLVGFDPTGIVPLHETETVWPAFVGTAISLESGDDARVPIAPTSSAARTTAPAARSRYGRPTLAGRRSRCMRKPFLFVANGRLRH